MLSERKWTFPSLTHMLWQTDGAFKERERKKSGELESPVNEKGHSFQVKENRATAGGVGRWGQVVTGAVWLGHRLLQVPRLG